MVNKTKKKAKSLFIDSFLFFFFFCIGTVKAEIDDIENNVVSATENIHKGAEHVDKVTCNTMHIKQTFLSDCQ